MSDWSSSSSGSLLADPVGALAEMVAPTVPAAVDELHVAAVLESRGVSDQSAHDDYGYDDVFALAAAVSCRLPRPSAAPVTPSERQLRAGMLRAVAHGPLYVLPSAVYPAMFAVLGPNTLVWGLVFATALSWVWGMCMSAFAYQLLGQGRKRAAARILRIFIAAGLGATLVGGTLLAWVGIGGPAMVVFIVAQMGFGLSSVVFVFYEKELWLAVLMLPACLTGVAYLVSGHSSSLVVPTATAGAVSIVLTLGAAWWTSVQASAPADPSRPTAWRHTLLAVAPSVGYAMLCALFMLATDARYVIAQVDLAIAVTPLVLGMGVVEWRAHRFTSRAGGLLHRDILPMRFRHEAWGLLLRELTMCMLTLGVLATVLLAVLYGAGVLHGDGAMLIDAHVILGGVYFLGFILARHEQFPRLLCVMSVGVAGNLIANWIAHGAGAPEHVPAIFLVSASALFVMLLVVLRMSVGKVYHHR